MVLNSLFRGASAALLAVFAFCAPARADMSFHVVQIGGAGCGAHCAMAIAADGDITDATAGEFLDFVRANSRSRAALPG